MARERIVWEDRALVNQLRTFNARMDRAIYATMKFHATRGTAYMRKNAPWTDQTSNARNGLFGTASREYPNYKITFGHTVDYGIWLEVRFSGRYAIIRPTIDKTGPEVMQTISQIYGKLFK